MSEPIGYVFEAHDFRTLQNICKRLFGDGTHLTIDQRRDLANLMDVTLSRVTELPDTSDIPEAGEDWFKNATLKLPEGNKP